MITKPTLFLDTDKCKQNIAQMYRKAQKHNLIFRPHFKTHQSLKIGQWFKHLGVEKITVSSVSMAKYFTSEWDDITIAFPVNHLEIDVINNLADEITLNLLAESEETIAFLSEHLTNKVNIFLKIDVGYHRTGINQNQTVLIDRILDGIENSSWMSFSGFLGHAGHTYSCRTQNEIKKIHRASMDIMATLKEKFAIRSPDLMVSLGDTPSCSVAKDFSKVDEIRPGNFVFYDLMQHQIGSNNIDQIVVAVACPIVALHKNRSEIVVYGGGVHFSKESLEDDEGTIYGRAVERGANGWGKIKPDTYVTRLSQEHGIISVPEDQFNQYSIGDYMMVLPVHSCMTANLMKYYCTLEGHKIPRM